MDNNWENYYGDRRPEFKYSLRTQLIVSTDKVKLVVSSQGKEADLLKQGLIARRGLRAVLFHLSPAAL